MEPNETPEKDPEETQSDTLRDYDLPHYYPTILPSCPVSIFELRERGVGLEWAIWAVVGFAALVGIFFASARMKPVWLVFGE